MNPSASGWISKFKTLFPKETILDDIADEIQFYQTFKNTGFIYGFSVKSILPIPANTIELTRAEYTKINLFHALLFQFFVNNPAATYNEAILQIIAYYKTTQKGKPTFLSFLNFSTKSESVLEQIIVARLQETNSIVERNATSVLTYALLFLDVIGFKRYLLANNTWQTKQEEFIKNYESLVLDYCFLALKAKKNKTKEDTQLITLYETSLDYIIDSKLFKTGTSAPSTFNLFQIEKLYILDLCTVAIWEDRVLDEKEFAFLKEVCNRYKIPHSQILKNIQELKTFSQNNETKVTLFQYKHPLHKLYKTSTKTVKQLIIRNKNRLTQELLESKELLVLLGQSTQRNLSENEKKKVKEQLLDICKTIPSLTIFLVPGGSLLLPLLIKFIPSLLPSAFNENKIE